MPSATALVVMNDVFFLPRISGAAKQCGLLTQLVREREVVLERALEEPAVLILDLNFVEIEPLELIRGLKGDPRTAGLAIVGFVSHVHTELRQRAQEAGCDVVVARSVFAQSVALILKPYGVV